MDSDLEIKTISHPIVLRYFETLNTEAFEQTSELFAVEGILQPPFEKEIVGRTAIAHYLNQEAKGILAEPRHGSSKQLEDGSTEVQITGKVQTPAFGVHASWQFIINADDELLFVRIKLIASPQELLGLKK